MTTSTRRDSAGRELLDRVVPAWRDALPSRVPRAYFDRFLVRHQDALVRRFEALAASSTARPRAGRTAVQALARRLLRMPQGVRVGAVRYHSPIWEPSEEELVITFEGEASEHSRPRMTLHAAPREGDEIDLRGVITEDDGQVVAQFDWEIMPSRELVLLRETALARWFGATTTPEPKMSPTLLKTLAVLQAEERSSGASKVGQPWAGMQEGDRDALLARGLAAVVLDPGDGLPRYKTTPEGRMLLAKTGTYITPFTDPKEIAAEEAHMGRALRAARDQEEGAFTSSVERGMAHEKRQNREGWDARSRVFKNLETDPHCYDAADVPRPRFTPALVYPLRFSRDNLRALHTRLGEAPMPARLELAGYVFEQSGQTIDDTGFVLVTYHTAARGNPRAIKLANGIKTKPFVPGPLVVYLTPRGTDAIFSIELKRHDGHQVVASNWVRGSMADITTLTGAEVADLVGIDAAATSPNETGH